MVTAQQLSTADTISLQLAETLDQLRATIRFALDAKVVGVPLDQTVITALQGQYATLKTQLQTLFQQLP